MKYSKLSNKSFTATMKHLLLMAFAILTIGCGEKKSEGNYKDDKLDGPVVTWHENGQKQIEANNKDGKLYGDARGWHENGQKSFESEWKNGKETSRADFKNGK